MARLRVDAVDATFSDRFEGVGSFLHIRSIGKLRKFCEVTCLIFFMKNFKIEKLQAAFTAADGG